MTVDLITVDDVEAAARAIAGSVVRTTVLPAAWAPGLHLKPESLQPVGSFKLRGATNAVSRLTPEQRARGVVTHSSGNHGLALAYAARVFGAPCVVVIPETAPDIKIAAVRDIGAEIVMVAPSQRVARAQRLAEERGLTLIPPYDHRDIIAGQGTVGLEILADCPDVEVVLVPVGGGGLASGVATAIKGRRPDVKVFGVEPDLAADAHESLVRGTMVTWEVADLIRTSADGLRVPLSELTFAHLHARLDGIITVTEAQITAATARLVQRSRLVVEPSGAVATAAFLFRRDQLPQGRTVAVITGGNVDPAVLAAAAAA
ncbi:threonine ammonia-lyase [Asanoa iriomotensis]|uniref:Serine/threonine dehydratase n=1 Tax=Asanoa iriomotensis TaxID=234613 RepID=A0ABQ4CCH4_9ACTN|nr:threonine/serine dehydratase [Asanoa iriomotensis]GIF60451.1 serine/threonine dehydratase [Asanoa iriomotensis]